VRAGSLSASGYPCRKVQDARIEIILLLCAGTACGVRPGCGYRALVVVSPVAGRFVPCDGSDSADVVSLGFCRPAVRRGQICPGASSPVGPRHGARVRLVVASAAAVGWWLSVASCGVDGVRPGAVLASTDRSSPRWPPVGAARPLQSLIQAESLFNDRPVWCCPVASRLVAGACPGRGVGSSRCSRRGSGGRGCGGGVALIAGTETRVGDRDRTGHPYVGYVMPRSCTSRDHRGRGGQRDPGRPGQR